MRNQGTYWCASELRTLWQYKNDLAIASILLKRNIPACKNRLYMLRVGDLCRSGLDHQTMRDQK